MGFCRASASLKLHSTLLVLTLAILGLFSGQAIAAGAVADSQCGGVLDARDIATALTYKFQTIVDPPESCIWTVQAPNRTEIRVNVTHMYFVNNHATDYISLGFFNKSNYDLVNSLTWIKLDHVHPQVVDLPGPVIFIHYVSTSIAKGLGFRLTYQATGDTESSIYHFNNYFCQGEYGAFHYPPEGGKYHSNERTTIVFKATASTALTAYLAIQNINIEETQDCLSGSFNMYSLNSTGTAWSKIKARCGSLTTTNDGAYFNRPRNDPIIVTFKSDDSVVGDGFELFWTNWKE